MSKYDDAVNAARNELANHVQEVPLGSNKGPRVGQYQAATFLPGSGWPWCVAFWLWCLKKAGIKPAYLGAGAYNMLDWARKTGHARTLAQAVPGDGVVLNVGSGHLAMLDKPYKGDGVVHTLNGNVSDRVAAKDWPANLVRGCVHMPDTTPPKPKPPLWQVVTSASGHKVVVFAGGKAKATKWLANHLGKYRQFTVKRVR